MLNVLRHMKVNKSSGPDQDTESRENLKILQALWLRYTAEQGMDNVSIFKVCKDKPGIYRQVRLTRVFDTLLESILRNKIYMHLNTHGLIRKSARLCAWKIILRI